MSSDQLPRFDFLWRDFFLGGRHDIEAALEMGQELVLFLFEVVAGCVEDLFEVFFGVEFGDGDGEDLLDAR